MQSDINVYNITAIKCSGHCFWVTYSDYAKIAIYYSTLRKFINVLIAEH